MATDPDDGEIEALAARLEAAIAPDTAVVKIKRHNALVTCHVLANRAGYLLLAALFLRAATAPVTKNAVVEVDTDEVLHEDSDLGIAWLERHEEFPPEKPSEPRRTMAGRGCFFVGVSFVLALVALLYIGAKTVYHWVIAP